MFDLLRRLNPFRHRDCYNCRFLERIHSTGDGQVTRWVFLCRCPSSARFGRPIPPELICDRWAEATSPPESPPA